MIISFSASNHWRLWQWSSHCGGVHPLHRSELSTARHAWKGERRPHNGADDCLWRSRNQHQDILPHSDRRDLGDINNPAGGEVSLLINMNMTAIIMSTLLMSLMTVPSLSVQ